MAVTKQTGKIMDIGTTFRDIARANELTAKRSVTVFFSAIAGLSGDFAIDNAAMDYVIPGSGDVTFRRLCDRHVQGRRPEIYLDAMLKVMCDLAPDDDSVSSAFGSKDKAIDKWVAMHVTAAMNAETHEAFIPSPNNMPVPLLDQLGGKTSSNAIAILKGFAAGCMRLPRAATTFQTQTDDIIITSVVYVGASTY
jgi:hypothetical protein